MKRLPTIFSLIFTVTSSFGQNLLPNPGFEDTVQCPNGVGDIMACSEWTYATQFSANFFHRCAINSLNEVPTTANQETLEGDGMIGIRALSDTLDYRGYVQVSLNSPLVIGQTYHVSIHVMLHKYSNHAMKTLGTCFTTAPVWANTSQLLNLTPQYENNTTWLANKTYWTRITGAFVADSAYTNFIIGNFNSDNDTEAQYIGFWGDEGSYYLIDEVCLSSSPSECKSLVANIEYIKSPNKKLIKVVDSMGRECHDEAGRVLFYIYNDGTIEKKILIE